MTLPFLYKLDSISAEKACGAKAAQIRWLSDHGFQVPATFLLPFSAEVAYRQNPQSFKRQLSHELAETLDNTKRYAVRSSANVEDQAGYSFAGQFTTLLDIQGVTALTDAVLALYDRLAIDPPEAYLHRIGAEGTPLQMAVIIQEMVDAVVSGVSFSKNPLTGLDEVIVEAVEGLGVGLIQGGQTPDRWVAKWGGWTQEPETTSINPGLIARVVDQTKKIAKAYGAPVDLEWVVDGDDIYWVQVRPITTAGDIQIYSNRIAREVLPGLIKPLVWSVNISLVNRAWVELFTELIGPNSIRPEDLARPFYYRAYFNMGVIGQIFELLGFPPESLELLLGLEGGSDRPTFKPSRKTYRHLPRMLRFLVQKLRFQGVIEKKLPELQAEFNRLAKIDVKTQPPERLLENINTLMGVAQEAAYLNIVIPLLMSGYNALLKRQLADLGVDFAQFDLTYGHAGIAAFDPTIHLTALHKEFESLGAPVRAHVEATQIDSWSQAPELENFTASFLQFIERFGHLSDSGNDFSSRPWREDPALVMKMIRDFHIADREHDKTRWEDLPLASHQRIPIRFVYRRARWYRYHREAISSLYTFGYGLFRQYFLGIGNHLQGQGVLAEQTDIFYLTYEEVKIAIQGDSKPGEIQNWIKQRMEELEAAQGMVLPEVIYGDELPPHKPGKEIQRRMSGIPSARGYYQGPVTVIQRVQDFDRLKPGDVLVIPYSDVSWTPLFGKAGAVIAESGGLLSHSSIVAREFNIPCVVSVNGACQLPDQVEVAVDGYSGDITILRSDG